MAELREETGVQRSFTDRETDEEQSTVGWTRINYGG